jgi:putative hemolysin
VLTESLIILVLVLLNGVFAGAEIAIVAQRRTRLRELVDKGSRTARAVQFLREHPERFLATVQIGITVVGATASAFGGASLALRLQRRLSEVPALAPIAAELALASVILGVSYLSLVLGELVPKSLALRASEPYALAMGRPLLALSSLARPLVWLLTASSNLVLRLFGDRTNFMEARISSDELQQMLEDASKAGAVHPGAGEIASRALAFSELTAEDVMVPRGQVVGIPLDAPSEDVRTLLLEQGHSRMPVFDGDMDRVVGYVTIKDVLSLAWEQKLFVLQDLLRPPYFVPESKRAVDLLHDLRTRRQHLAIVVDEAGGTAGIVTTEDLLEELVGEMFSEHSVEVPTAISLQPDGSALVLGSVPVRDVNRALGITLPEEGDWTTIAGLCLALARHIPARGYRMTTADGTLIEVTDASPRRIKAVRVTPSAPGMPSPGR